MSTPPPRRWSTKVVGVSFVPGYPENVRMLSEAWSDLARMGVNDGEAIPARLIRILHNPHDRYAVEVHAAETMLGHVPAKNGMSERVAGWLDAGHMYQAEITAVNIHPDNPNNPGIVIGAVKQGTTRTGLIHEQHES